MRRRLALAAAGLALVGGPIVAALLTRPSPGGDGVTAVAVAAPVGAVVLAAQAGPYAVGLEVGDGSPRATVLDQEGRRVPGARVRVADAHAVVSVRGQKVAFTLPKLPAPPAAGIVARATRAWHALRSVTLDERLAARPGNSIETTFVQAAPDRLTYRIVGGAQAVVIGTRRWDRASAAAPWRRSEQIPALVQPTPPWLMVASAHVLNATPSAWTVSFVDARFGRPIWFTATIQRRTYRTLDLHMVTAAHFMHERYRAFNAPVQIAPPVR
jgi:hypothetical protein